MEQIKIDKSYPSDVQDKLLGYNLALTNLSYILDCVLEDYEENDSIRDRVITEIQDKTIHKIKEGMNCKSEEVTHLIYNL